eukprot:TRINITY_DN1479_c0_g1_i4.p1 TRINITY_DN1479_c0_g1~~TRINITY_DN1479_c0_g1_i4.p1  ORF type:complete len:166 (+),score=1.79 TRINITY_DN1479_c0_g1_i4:85-582(+)
MSGLLAVLAVLELTFGGVNSIKQVPTKLNYGDTYTLKLVAKSPLVVTSVSMYHSALPQTVGYVGLDLELYKGGARVYTGVLVDLSLSCNCMSIHARVGVVADEMRITNRNCTSIEPTSGYVFAGPGSVSSFTLVANSTHSVSLPIYARVSDLRYSYSTPKVRAQH